MMNTARKMSYENSCTRPEKTKLKLVFDKYKGEEMVMVDGKLMSKSELNEKLAYFYEHGGPVMDI
ncbi:MAG: hypothetical protein ACM3NJ_00710 [Methanobacterium sp.]